MTGIVHGGFTESSETTNDLLNEDISGEMEEINPYNQDNDDLYEKVCDEIYDTVSSNLACIPCMQGLGIHYRPQIKKLVSPKGVLNLYCRGRK